MLKGFFIPNENLRGRRLSPPSPSTSFAGEGEAVVAAFFTPNENLLERLFSEVVPAGAAGESAGAAAAGAGATTGGAAAGGAGAAAAFPAPGPEASAAAMDRVGAGVFLDPKENNLDRLFSFVLR